MSVPLADAVAIVVIGDGVVGALFPSRHVARWMRGPAAWRAVMRPFADHPGLTRVVGVAEVGVGLWWAGRLPPRAP